jgi:hypothetical protein
MATNVDGLLLCWHFITVSSQLKPNRIADDEVNNKCLKDLHLLDIR